MSRRRQVAVVTGGGSGIGAAIAEAVARRDWFVVTVDPLVTVDGAELLPEPEQTTAGRIAAAGGWARASSVSVTDPAALGELFDELVHEHGGVDAVVNVAGITRKSRFAEGTEEDWLELLAVHLGGYLNVLGAALPVMERAGRGRIVGVTSGAGWRATDAGGYGCAKRVVASLTWQLGRLMPAGLAVNAISPIAATRMFAVAVERARQEGRTAGAGGFSLFSSIPGPETLGPLGAHMVCDDRFGWCSGLVLFAGGSEAAVIDEPRLLEVVRTDGASPLAGVLDTVLPAAFVPAEAKQSTDGGGNPRFGKLFEEPAPAAVVSGDVRSCVVVSDRPDLAAAITGVLGARSVTCRVLEPTRGFTDADQALRSEVARGPVDAIVAAPSSGPDRVSVGGWRQVLSEHHRIIDQIHADAGWARAAARYAADGNRQIRLVTVTDATTSGGRSRAQGSAQLARVSGATTEGRVSAFAIGHEVSDERAGRSLGELVGHLLTHPAAVALAGAELVAGDGWVGLRSHPKPVGALIYGGPALPDWFDTVVRDMARGPESSRFAAVSAAP